MEQRMVTRSGVEMPVYTFSALVVGSGAAGLNAADRLAELGMKDVAVVTENFYGGTSRNTGSDKQTYYKLTLSGGEADSIQDMAQTIFDGGCTDGDHALAEAALSAQCFFRLTELGVPFPKNEHGEYVGYKTDHDPRQRATSVGPYTSKVMTECLEASVSKKDITIFDGMQVVKILTWEGKAAGLICLTRDKEHPVAAFSSSNIIYATGGPAGIYADSAYPIGHYGATGLALEAGAKGKNLTEWQCGLASLKPRWNVSGTYMQALPKLISTDQGGENPREFLADYFESPQAMLSLLFLKGYQWPFDVRKAKDGSSVIDLLVYQETKLKNRRVFLDFRDNPGDRPIPFSMLREEARDYLDSVGASFGTPIQRLVHINSPAVDFYLERGVDLTREPLEVAICAQHNNGGLSVDQWWQTSVEGLFAAGEVAASHGVYRPGGSALNAGQVGSMRAAQYIAARRKDVVLPEGCFDHSLTAGMKSIAEIKNKALGHSSNVEGILTRTTMEMSASASIIRNQEHILTLRDQVGIQLKTFGETVKVDREGEMKKLFRLRDTLITQFTVLSAMADYVERGGKSRGSGLYVDQNGALPHPFLTEFPYQLDDGRLNEEIQEITYHMDGCQCAWRGVRPIPQRKNVFETVWRQFRDTGGIH